MHVLLVIIYHYILFFYYLAPSITEIYETAHRGMAHDGLNTTQHKLLGIEFRTLYTHMFVHIPGPKSRIEAAELMAQLHQQPDIE